MFMEMVISKVMQELKQFIEQMRATSSSNEKVEILKQQSDFIKKVLSTLTTLTNSIMLLVRHVRKTQVYLSIILTKIYLNY